MMKDIEEGHKTIEEITRETFDVADKSPNATVGPDDARYADKFRRDMENIAKNWSNIADAYELKKQDWEYTQDEKKELINKYLALKGKRMLNMDK